MLFTRRGLWIKIYIYDCYDYRRIRKESFIVVTLLKNGDEMNGGEFDNLSEKETIREEIKKKREKLENSYQEMKKKEDDIDFYVDRRERRISMVLDNLMVRNDTEMMNFYQEKYSRLKHFYEEELCRREEDRKSIGKLYDELDEEEDLRLKQINKAEEGEE